MIVPGAVGGGRQFLQGAIVPIEQQRSHKEEGDRHSHKADSPTLTQNDDAPSSHAPNSERRSSSTVLAVRMALLLLWWMTLSLNSGSCTTDLASRISNAAVIPFVNSSHQLKSSMQRKQFKINRSNNKTRRLRGSPNFGLHPPSRVSVYLEPANKFLVVILNEPFRLFHVNLLIQISM
jgi:hypothetical protein